MNYFYVEHQLNVKCLVLAAALLIASAYDLRWRRIPNWLTFSMLFASLTYHSFDTGISGLLFGIQGAGAGIGVLLIFYLLGGLGAGDVKLMGAIGAFLGPWDVFNVFLITALLGGIYAVIVLLFNKIFIQTIRRYWLLLNMFLVTRRVADIPSPATKRTPRLCYGVVIAIGTFSFLITGGII